MKNRTRIIDKGISKNQLGQPHRTIEFHLTEAACVSLAERLLRERQSRGEYNHIVHYEDDENEVFLVFETMEADNGKTKT